jgi:hypothetical protein
LNFVSVVMKSWNVQPTSIWKALFRVGLFILQDAKGPNPKGE